jgi:hypothetical protein
MILRELDSRVAAVSNGVLSRAQIAEILGCTPAQVKKALARMPQVPRRPAGPPSGSRNPSWRGGRILDRDGYVLLAKKPLRKAEHRVVMEQVLGRPLRPEEVVDHIDGITIHNDPSNLRVFATNGDHLRETTTETGRNWSAAGRRNIGARTDRGREIEPVDTYRLRRERGDVQLRALLRAALELGIAHPCLSGMLHKLTQNGIDPASRPSLERAWADLERRYAEDLVR